MTFSALLLAGGESRRMGRDKAMLDFGGQPLWERQLELIRALGPEKIFVSARTAPAWLPDNVELLLDDLPSRGPISGVAKALAAIGTTHLVALAVDMPFMTVSELERLLQLVAEDRGVVPLIGGRAEPLAAVYPATAAANFQAALAGSDWSLQPIVRKLDEIGKVGLVPVQDTSLYRSINEPSDFKEGRFPNRPSEFLGGL
jgi:molybdopterin-guanine dinucleotide biosynthesis protein A